MTAVEKVNSSPALAAAAKIGMFLTPILVSIGLFVIGNYLSSQAQAMSSLADRVTIGEKVNSNFDTRLTVVESRAETQAKEVAKMSDAIDQLDGKLEAVGKDASEASTGVRYIRDWVRELKEEAKRP